jgi:hypothetical protein
MSEASMPPIPRRTVAALAIAVVVLLALGYSLHERSLARHNSEQNAQLNASLQQTRGEIAALTQKIATLSQTQQAQPTLIERAPTEPVRQRKPSAARSMRATREDPRWKKFQSELDAQGRQIESTRNDLATARDDLSGSIARTHDEIVVLQKKGERNYYEFDLQKSKQFAPNGPVGISLRKANTKHQYADLQLLIDDVNLTRKHVNLYEPVMFYTADGAQPAELVINSITKDHIRGYISEPKYRRSDLAALSNAQPNRDAANPPAATEPRKKLQLTR